MFNDGRGICINGAICGTPRHVAHGILNGVY
jgi:hypothetical protein